MKHYVTYGKTYNSAICASPLTLLNRLKITKKSYYLQSILRLFLIGYLHLLLPVSPHIASTKVNEHNHYDDEDDAAYNNARDLARGQQGLTCKKMERKTKLLITFLKYLNIFVLFIFEEHPLCHL